jgi:hypothetical protein
LNKIIYVRAFFKPVGEEVTVEISTGETKKNFLGIETKVVEKQKKWQQTGSSDCRIDGERLADDINEAVAKLNEDGYEIIAIESVISGSYNYKWDKYDSSSNTSANTCYSYGYGFSYTEGVTIIAKKYSSYRA